MDDWSTSPANSKTEKESVADANAGESVKDLIRTIYGSFHVEDGTVRVGLVKSGATAQVFFDFNAYNDLDQLDEKIEELRFPKSAGSNIGNLLWWHAYCVVSDVPLPSIYLSSNCLPLRHPRSSLLHCVFLYNDIIGSI